MPGIVSHVYFISLLIREWGLLSFSLHPSLPLSLTPPSVSHSLCVFPPFFGALFLNPPHKMRFFRRMVTKSNCFIWMMHLGIYVLFSTVIIVFILCCSCKLSNLVSRSLYAIFPFSCVLYGLALSLYFSPASLPLNVSVPCLSRMWSMWECRDCFDWSLCCIWRLLIGRNFTFFGLLLTLGHGMHPYLAACNFCVIWLLILSNRCFCTPSFSPLYYYFFDYFFLGL